MTRITIFTTAVVLLFVAAFAPAQSDMSNRQLLPGGSDSQFKRGEQIYNQSCTGYCHGPKGSQGIGGPGISGRGLDAKHIETVIRKGAPGMPAYEQMLPAAGLEALIAYVNTLNGSGSTSRPPAVLTPEAEHGRDLFFQVTKEVRRCSNCHRVNGRGLDVAPIRRVPADVSALRNLTPKEVSSALVDGETFPALLMAHQGEVTKVYDLTAALPVLRIFPRSAVRFSKARDWRHSTVIGESYSDAELGLIITFLNVAIQP